MPFVDYYSILNKEEIDNTNTEIETTNDRTNDYMFIKKTINDKNNCKYELLLDDLKIDEIKKYNELWHTSLKRTVTYKQELMNTEDNFTNYSLYINDDNIYICDIKVNKCDEFEYKIDDYTYKLYDVKTKIYADDIDLFKVDDTYKLLIYNEDDKLIDVYLFDQSIKR